MFCFFLLNICITISHYKLNGKTGKPTGTLFSISVFTNHIDAAKFKTFTRFDYNGENINNLINIKYDDKSLCRFSDVRIFAEP